MDEEDKFENRTSKNTAGACHQMSLQCPAALIATEREARHELFQDMAVIRDSEFGGKAFNEDNVIYGIQGGREVQEIPCAGTGKVNHPPGKVNHPPKNVRSKMT